MKWLALLGLWSCVDLSKPRAYQCDPEGLSLDEPARQARCLSTAREQWYCALDGYCANAQVATTRECRVDAHCPSEHRCGTTEDSTTVRRCRDVSVDSAFRCRPDAGDADCGPTWRCGLEGACHPRVGASVRCATDFDCDQAWRCGKGGRCVDPRGEGLFAPASVSAPVTLNPVIDFYGDGGGRFLVSPTSFEDGGIEFRMVVRGERAFAIVTGPEGALNIPLSSISEGTPGALSALGTSALFEAQGTRVLVTPLRIDAGASVQQLTLDAPVRALSVLSIDSTEFTTMVLDAGPSASFVDFFSGSTSTRLVVDAGVVSVASFPRGSCDDTPALLVTSDALAAWVPDGGFRGGAPSSVMPFTALPRVSLAQLVGEDPSSKRIIERVVPGEESLAVLYESRPVGLPAARAGVHFVAAVRVLPGCRFPPRASLNGPACPGLEPAIVLAVTPFPLPDGGATVASTCAQGDRQPTGDRQATSTLGSSRITVAERGLVAQVNDGFAVINSSGVLGVGQGGEARAVALSTPAEAVLELRQQGTIFTAGRTIYAKGNLGLEPVASTEDRAFMAVAALPYGEDATLLRNGLVIDSLSDGGVSFLATLPSETEALWGSVFANDVLVVAAGDGLWTATLSPPTPVTLSLRARPALGFPITSVALVPHPDGGIFQGMAIAQDRLFTVEALSPSRVNTSEVALGLDDPRQVYFETVRGEHRGRVVLSTGQVLSWPQLVPLSEPLTGSVTVAAQCGATMQLSGEGLFRLEASDAGLGRWVDVGGVVGRRAADRPGTLHRIHSGLVVSLQGGGTWEFPVTCP